MIYIYKVNIDDENNPLLVDIWDNKFKISSKKMNREEVINNFNNGYYFTSEKEIEKVSINKSELIKSNHADFPPSLSYDKENRKFEDKVVNDMSDWIKSCEKNLKDELKQFYENNLNY